MNVSSHFHEKLQSLAEARAHHHHHLLFNSTFLDGVCPRKVWLTLRGFKPLTPSYRQWRKRQQHQRELTHQLAELRSCGIMVEAVHPKTKQAITFIKDGMTIPMTGIAKYEYNDPDTGFPSGWFLVQIDNITQQLLQSVFQQGIKHAYPALWGHCILGMGHSRISHCLVYLCADNGAVYAELLTFDEHEFIRLSELARGLLLSAGLPDRLEASNCTTCHNQEVCHSPTYVPSVSCYSCYYHMVQDEGIVCAKHQRAMEPDVWQEGCSSHLFLPDLINFAKKQSEVTLENEQLGIIYKLEDGTMFTNCGSKVPRKGMMFSSVEIYVGGVVALNNKTLQDVKNCFEGSKIVSSV